MNVNEKLMITELQRFCMHDGPGLRTTVFLKGCPLRCAWCHNPETGARGQELLLDANKCLRCGACLAVCPGGVHTLGEIHAVDRDRCVRCGACGAVCPTAALSLCGVEMTAEEILREVLRDRDFYGERGGVTFSGGEPFVWGEALLSCLRLCKAAGLSTAVETCGYGDTATFLRSVPEVDLYLWDLKDTDDARHLRYTGVSSLPILENLRAIDGQGAAIRLRCILVNGVNTDRAHYEAVARIAKALHRSEGVEILPYHAFGGSKSLLLGREENGRAEWIPTEEQIGEFEEILSAHGVAVRMPRR